MEKNTKQSGAKVVKLAHGVMKDENSSALQRSLAASVLAQANTDKQTSKEMETKAAAALKDPSSDETTKTLAGSVIAQANKDR